MNGFGCGASMEGHGKELGLEGTGLGELLHKRIGLENTHLCGVHLDGTGRGMVEYERFGLEE